MASASVGKRATKNSEPSEREMFSPDRRGEGSAIVVVVGQVPPPMNGQSLMISEFLSGTYSRLILVHVPMAFSRVTSDIGSFQMGKVTHLLQVLKEIVQARLRTKATILYYPPAGPNLVPVLRDFVLLLSTRWLFRRTVFHFHAAGLCEIYPRLPLYLRLLFHLTYDKPDLAIFPTVATANDATQLKAKSVAIVPCGVADRLSELPDRLPLAANGESAGSNSTISNILFAGILCEGKGIVVLLDACRILGEFGFSFHLTCMGSFLPQGFEEHVRQKVHDDKLDKVVSFPGVLSGEKKHKAFTDADIFCFPSHYPSESFGVVLIEAMSYSLPIVATHWRGIPEVTGTDGAYLVPVQDAEALAATLQKLIVSPQLRRNMGQRNRIRYLEHFTLDRYRRNLEGHLHALL